MALPSRTILHCGAATSKLVVGAQPNRLDTISVTIKNAILICLKLSLISCKYNRFDIKISCLVLILIRGKLHSTYTHQKRFL